MPTDITLTEIYDVEIAKGDFVAGESTYQHQALLLLCNKGEFKEKPARGVGAMRYLDGEDTQDFAREIDVEFARDGMKVKKIKLDIPHVDIDAYYDY